LFVKIVCGAVGIADQSKADSLVEDPHMDVQKMNLENNFVSQSNCSIFHYNLDKRPLQEVWGWGAGREEKKEREEREHKMDVNFFFGIDLCITPYKRRGGGEVGVRGRIEEQEAREVREGGD